ncbi:MAG: GNAT family N-acetyltransferase [Pseudomonadota bacterium]
MGVVVERDDATRPDVRRLVETHIQVAAELSPPESVHAMAPETLSDPSITVWTAREDGVLMGCGALKKLDSFHGEIKSMHTASDFRRRGVAAALLEHIIAEAQERGYRRLSLETGTVDAYAPARSLYARHGFDECQPFAHYRPDPHSVYMTCRL